jgi:hypothetical protein
MGMAKAAEVLAEPRSLPLPTTDPDVDVIAFRKDPPVATRNDSQLEDDAAAIAVRPKPVVGYVAFHGNSNRLVSAELERSRAEPVDSVGTHERACVDSLAAHDDGDSVTPSLHTLDLRSVAEVGSSIRSLLGQVSVEATPLRHRDERVSVAALDPRAVAKPHADARADVLDDRIDPER